MRRNHPVPACNGMNVVDCTERADRCPSRCRWARAAQRAYAGFAPGRAATGLASAVSGVDNALEEAAMDDAIVLALALMACAVIMIFTLGPFGVLLGGVLLLVGVGIGIAKAVSIIAGRRQVPH